MKKVSIFDRIAGFAKKPLVAKTLLFACIALFIPFVTFAQEVVTDPTTPVTFSEFFGQLMTMTGVVAGIVATVLTEIINKYVPSNRTMHWVRSVVVAVAIAVVAWKSGFPSVKITDVGYFMSLFFFAKKFILSGDATPETR